MDVVAVIDTAAILVGLGAVLAGCGSCLTGVAAIRSARKEGVREAAVAADPGK